MRQVLFPLCAFGLIAIAVPVQAGPIRNFLQNRGIGKQSTPMATMPITTTVTPSTTEPPMAPGTTPSTSAPKAASTDNKVTPASASDTTGKPATTADAGTKPTDPTTLNTMPMQPQYMPTSTPSGRRHLLPRNRG